jgi:ABC-2 type transport system permease protein
LGDVERFRVLLLDQFRFFVLVIPAMVANVFATLSIVEEKMTRTLEPLLATPVRTWELLVGKILSGAIPALAVTWASTGIFVLLTISLGWGPLLRWVIDPSWYLSIFLLTPAVSILSFALGVIGSSRASDAKAAQNLAVLVVLPLFALIAVQVIGLVRFTPFLTLGLSVGITALDGLLLRLAVRLFARESILIRWR